MPQMSIMEPEPGLLPALEELSSQWPQLVLGPYLLWLCLALSFFCTCLIPIEASFQGWREARSWGPQALLGNMASLTDQLLLLGINAKPNCHSS